MSWWFEIVCAHAHAFMCPENGCWLSFTIVVIYYLCVCICPENGVDWVSPLTWFVLYVYVCDYYFWSTSSLKNGVWFSSLSWFAICACTRAHVCLCAFFFFTFDQPATLKRGLIEFHHCCDLLFVCVHAAVCVYYFWSASNLKMGVDLVSSLSWSVICDSHSFMYGILKLPLYNTLLPFFVQVFNWPWCLR